MQKKHFLECGVSISTLWVLIILLELLVAQRGGSDIKRISDGKKKGVHKLGKKRMK